MSVNCKDKTNRITLRLNDVQFDFVKAQADVLGVSPSEFLRMVINASKSASDYAKQQIEERKAIGRENDKAHFDNLV